MPMLGKTVLEAENINSQYIVGGGNCSDSFFVTRQTTSKRIRETSVICISLLNRLGMLFTKEKLRLVDDTFFEAEVPKLLATMYMLIVRW